MNSTLVQDDDNESDNQNNPDSEFDVIIRSTLLTDNVNLPGGRSQVIVVGEFDGDNSNDTFYIQEPTRNVSFASENDGPQYQNIRVQPISQVLTPPGNLTSVITALDLTQLATLLQGSNLVDTLAGAENGLTIFAPQNSAIEGVQQAISSASTEEQTNVLRNHVLMNTVVYSTQLPEEDNEDDDDDNDNDK